MSHVDELIDTAQLLVDEGSTEGDYRRAISTAYYAAFHCLVDAVSEMLIRHEASKARVRRLMQHTELARVARAYATAPENQADQQKYLDGLKRYGQVSMPNEMLVKLASGFVQLHQSREAADYNLETKVGATQAKESVTEARRVVARVRQLRQDQDDGLACLLGGALFRARRE